MSLKQYVSRIIAEPRTAFVALTWVGFMVFFTYTDLIVALMTKGVSVTTTFHAIHITAVSLLVNMGLIVMLMFDYSTNRNKNKHLHWNWVWVIITGLILTFLIYVHCLQVHDKSHLAYIFPISWDNLSIALFIILLFVVFVLKTFVEFSNAIPVTEQQRG